MRKILLGILIVVVLIAGGAFAWVYIAGESTLRAAVERRAPEVFDARVELDAVRFRPFAGHAALRDLAIWNPQGFSEAQALDLGRVSTDLRPLSLFSDVVEIKEVRIDAPTLRIEPSQALRTNLQALYKNVQEFVGAPAEPRPAEKGKAVKIDNFYLTDAVVVIGGGPIGFSEQRLELADIHLQDIGGADGVAPAQALKLVMDALMPQVQKALATQTGQQLLSQAQQQLAAVRGRAEELKGELEGKVEEQKGAVEEKLKEQTGKLPGDVGTKAQEQLEKGLGGLLGKKDKQEEPQEEEQQQEEPPQR